MSLKITDKSQKAGLRTKNVFIRGFPAVIFCSAGLRIDEQEGTRFFLLSPETNQEKIRESIQQKIRKECDNTAFANWLDANPERLLLKERIKAIRDAHINEIRISDPNIIERAFLDGKNALKPRHQRDVGRLIAIAKGFALLNFWFRELNGNTITTNKDDINEAIKIWEKISESQEYNLPPFIYVLYKKVIIPAFQESKRGINNCIGVSRQEVSKKHFEAYGRPLQDWMLRQQIIPMLESAGLIIQESDPKDSRKKLICPTTQIPASEPENNSELGGGVSGTPNLYP